MLSLLNIFFHPVAPPKQLFARDLLGFKPHYSKCSGHCRTYLLLSRCFWAHKPTVPKRRISARISRWPSLPCVPKLCGIALRAPCSTIHHRLSRPDTSTRSRVDPCSLSGSGARFRQRSRELLSAHPLPNDWQVELPPVVRVLARVTEGNPTRQALQQRFFGLRGAQLCGRLGDSQGLKALRVSAALTACMCYGLNVQFHTAAPSATAPILGILGAEFLLISLIVKTCEHARHARIFFLEALGGVEPPAAGTSGL